MNEKAALLISSAAQAGIRGYSQTSMEKEIEICEEG